MHSNSYIEVAVPVTTSTTQRGAILERFAKRLLATQNFEVTDQIRLTGMEVDLFARDRDTGERILVECKAHRSAIGAEVLQKLLGNVGFRSVESGWLLSTHALGKDAKGLQHEWEQRPPSERKKLRIYEPERLVARLVAAQVIVEPRCLVAPANSRNSNDFYLLLTATGEYWVIPLLDRDTGIRKFAAVYNAQNGERVEAKDALLMLSETDSSLAELIGASALVASEQSKHDTSLQSELQSIVQVPVADNWADYRPARPGDFVGREVVQKSIFDFFDQVRSEQTRTRLFAIKGPSGWGKSSLVLKIASRSRNIRNRNKTFVFAVDARAASSKRFGELALFSTFRAAFGCGFLAEPPDFTFGGAANPFATPAMTEVLSQLRREQKTICLIFDQFEELLYKAELEGAFDQLSQLCNAVDEAQANIVVGFSWKTDGTVPTEHKAYHLWHNYADRRREFELTPFDSKDIAAALNHFQLTLGQDLAPQLRRLLVDHCQGYPWLLKKLCVHVYELIKNGKDQAEILGRSLSIEDLFRKDLEKLSAAEHACIKLISQEAPAEYFRIADAYGDDVLTALFSKRLIIRSGPRLNVYWDIFRDYVLTERAPFIPVNYIPQSSLSTYLAAVHVLLRSRDLSYSELAEMLKIAKGTAENVVRDMVMVGHADANRKSETVSTVQFTEEDAARKIVSFCQSHIIYRSLYSEFGTTTGFSFDALMQLLRALRPDVKEALLEQYAQKMFRWLITAGLLEKQGTHLALRQSSTLKRLDDPENKTYTRGGADLFLADAPYQKAIGVLETIQKGETNRDNLERLHGRNAVRVLAALGILDRVGDVLLTKPSADPPVDVLRKAAADNPTLSFVRAFLIESPNVSGADIGTVVSEKFGIEWSKASKQRTGAALRNWVHWLDGKRQIGRGRKPSRGGGAGGITHSKKTPIKSKRLTPELKLEIIRRWSSGETLRQIADRLGVCVGTVWRWKTLSVEDSQSS